MALFHRLIVRSSPALPALAGLLLVAGCGEQQAPPAPPPVQVVVETIKTQSVPNIVELPGRIEAVRSAEVRARTDGIVERRLYREGTDVKAGQPLFAIDPRDKRAALQQAQAALRRAEAARQNSEQIVRRYKPLVSDRAVSAQEYDAALSELRQAEANVADAKATVSRAELELGYTTVRAPISGRVGRAQVTEGALVSASGATLMTTVEQLDPVFAVFTQASSDAMSLIQRARAGVIKLPSLTRMEVELVLEDGTRYGPIGHLDFADQAVDPSTGSIVLRAQFPNILRMLLPGQFVRGRIRAGMVEDGVLVSQRAVQLRDEEAIIFIVNEQNVVEARPVALGALVGGNWVVRSGLKAGDRVIVDGWQRTAPGQTVNPVAPGAPGSPAAAAPAQTTTAEGEASPPAAAPAAK